MTSAAPSNVSKPSYRERLIPGPGLFIALLLLLPAVALVLTPINRDIAIPTAVIVYVIAIVTLILLSPSIIITGNRLQAGHAEIPTTELGEVELLGSEELRTAIGPGLDARSYLLVRGWIHSGVRIQNIDPTDPAPSWILTTRHPKKLAEAIAATKATV